MPNPYFQFKQFTVFHDRCAMKVTTDSCLFGAWCASEIQHLPSAVHHLLDIGTGTGLLSLFIAQKNNLPITAVEIDAEAARQAKENSASSPWHQAVKVYHSDIRRFQPEMKFDCIISNPPFYENELASQHHQKNLAHHSTQLNFSELFGVIRQHLSDKGRFFLLLPFKRVTETEKLLAKHHLCICTKVEVKQSVAHHPFRVMVMGSKTPQPEVLTTTLSIRDAHQHYTPEFIELLKDYYLYL